MAQTTYAPMFVWTVLVFLDQMIKKKERRRTNLPLLDLSASPQVKIQIDHPLILWTLAIFEKLIEALIMYVTYGWYGGHYCRVWHAPNKQHMQCGQWARLQRWLSLYVPEPDSMVNVQFDQPNKMVSYIDLKMWLKQKFRDPLLSCTQQHDGFFKVMDGKWQLNNWLTGNKQKFRTE